MSRVRTTLTVLSAAMISLSGQAFAASDAPSRNVMSILNYPNM
jgi:hypothetical protein